MSKQFELSESVVVVNYFQGGKLQEYHLQNF